MTFDAGHTPEREVLGRNGSGDATREVATPVRESGFEPDMVAAVARGWLLRAGAVAYALDPRGRGAIDGEFSTGVDLRLDEPVRLSPVLDLPPVSDQRVLPVDVVSDSGRTLARVRAVLLTAGAEVGTFCLYSRPKTVLERDVVWRKSPKRIALPWSSLPPVTA